MKDPWWDTALLNRWKYFPWLLNTRRLKVRETHTEISVASMISMASPRHHTSPDHPRLGHDQEHLMQIWPASTLPRQAPVVLVLGGRGTAMAKAVKDGESRPDTYKYHANIIIYYT